MQNLDTEKFRVPEGWAYKEARALFEHPEVVSAEDPLANDIRWERPDEERLIEFMVTQNGFNEKRIRTGIEKLVKAKSKSTQGRLDAFFKIAAPAASEKPTKTLARSAKKAKRAGKSK